ncbi:MAG: SIS domain-containing protein [Alphaproteobacteria bacterium]|nr:SIS domain-containing protein [Alphaproteobacteria bacterium]
MTSRNLDHTAAYLDAVQQVARSLDGATIDRIVAELAALRERGGRLFILGVGGSAGNAGHAVNDFRKLCDIEAYAPTDNVSELTARTNDEGWHTVFAEWLKTSRASDKDGILVFSVGGGNAEKNVSANIVHALDEARRRGCRIMGIVGRDGGYTARVGHVVLVIPTVDESLTTPLTEAFQAVVWHGIVCHPGLRIRANKWEGLQAAAKA